MITTQQVKAARMLLSWSQAQLAERAGIPLSTLKRIDGRKGPIQAHSDNVWKIQTALEEAGIEFVLKRDRIGVSKRL